MAVLYKRRSAHFGFLLVVLTMSTCQVAPRVDAQVQAATYYVSPLGNDSNLGNLTQPWKTIQKAAETMLPGESVTVLSGIYDERVQVTRSGTFGAPITFQASGAVSMHGFTVKANYVTINGFDITDTPDDPADGIGIFVQGTNCIIENNYVHYATRGGILLYTSPGNFSETSNCIVRNNRLYRNAMNGVDVNGRNHLIEANEVWGTIQYHPRWQNPPDWVDADGMLIHGSGHVFRKNYIHDIHYGILENINPHIDCFQTFGDDPYSEVASNVVFEKNTCVNLDAQSPYEVGQGFMIGDASNLTIRNNVIQAYRNVNAVRSTNLRIVNNVFTGAISSTVVYGPSAVTLSESPNATVKNNVFYDTPGHSIYLRDSVSQQGLDVGYNSAYRSDGQQLWDTPYPHDLWGINPLFVAPLSGDFHLQPNSPLIDAGEPQADVPDDFDGVSRPQGRGYDIGIYEYPFSQKVAIPGFAHINDTVIFAISFISNGHTVTVTDTLPLQFTHLESNASCEGTVSYNSGTRLVIYLGMPPIGDHCTIRIDTQVNTGQIMTVMNTAIVDNSLTLPQRPSAIIILNGSIYYFPFIFKAR